MPDAKYQLLRKLGSDRAGVEVGIGGEALWGFWPLLQHGSSRCIGSGTSTGLAATSSSGVLASVLPHVQGNLCLLNIRYETRAQFENRLDRTARNLDPVFIKKSIENMRERCQKLAKAQGSSSTRGSYVLLCRNGLGPSWPSGLSRAGPTTFPMKKC